MDADFEALAIWASRHEAMNLFRARLIHDNTLQPGEIVYGDHEVRMHVATRAELERWADAKDRGLLAF